MQIIGPYSAVGFHQDSVGPAVAPVTPIAPVTAAQDGASSGQTRSDTGERGQTPARPVLPLPDPDRPAGPPPSFDTTPLELEAERRQTEASALWRDGFKAAESEQRQLDLEV